MRSLRVISRSYTRIPNSFFSFSLLFSNMRAPPTASQRPSFENAKVCTTDLSCLWCLIRRCCRSRYPMTCA